ncbi:helix-turn-helix domain-containing protein [Roseixanthobacter glucoisosaccharinicivorans]|uniref:helix-turn-helix domain-containing protein n=1 Tax=Roseixanthobacter glucoisosaccharinicivorans TaxID=3119923 RepID=UPI00372D3368
MLDLEINIAERRRQKEEHHARQRRLWPVTPVAEMECTPAAATQEEIPAPPCPPTSMPDRIIEIAEAAVGLPRDWLNLDDPERGPSVARITGIVSRYFGISRCDIVSQRRTANVVKPRQIAMYLAKTLTPRSLPDIGRRFGGRDHTTVLHAVRKIDGLIKTDALLRKQIEMLRCLIDLSS